MAVVRVLVFGTLTVAVSLAATAGLAGAVTVEAAIVDALDRDGRYLEGSDPEIDAAVDDANRIGVAFVWLADSAGLEDAETLADDYVAELEAIGSEYHTVLVLTEDAYAAFSTVHSDPAMDDALEAAFASFSSGSASRGVSTFTDSLQGVVSTETEAGTTATTTAQSADDSSSGGGIGFGSILLVVAVLGGGFMLFRSWSKRRKQLDQAAVDLEEDRVEIEEQLKNNADRVILLGDRVIASGNRELIDLYEEASHAYQDVSQTIDNTETAEGIDALDDKIDEAEWQFEVIEARLDGRPEPPPPGLEDAAPAPSGSAPPPPVPADRRVPSNEDRSVITSPTTGRDYRRPSGSTSSAGRRTQTRRRGGGLGGGGLGGILGGVLGNIILGGGLGGSSRRTQRRSGGLGIPNLGGRSTSTRSTGTGGLGGGVLRRGGGSPPARSRSNTRARTRPTRRRPTTRGGGRSLGNRRGGGRTR